MFSSCKRLKFVLSSMDAKVDVDKYALQLVATIYKGASDAIFQVNPCAMRMERAGQALR
jgi:hypothetical protein